MTGLIKEVCVHCQASVNLGQAITECSVCDCIIHSKCFDKSIHVFFENEFFCSNCKYLATKRYNPFKTDFENDEIDENDILHSVAQKLTSCKSHNIKEINNSYTDLLKEHTSIFFQNIDGNKSNFDTLAVSLKQFTAKFPIIALAETNVCPENGELYQITDYTPKYQNKIAGKNKGSGVAIYVHNSLNATINSNLSQVTENLETIFVTLSGERPTTVGVLYRPPSGNIDEAMDELKNVLEHAPKRTHIAGDFNIDLHDDKCKIIDTFENILFSRGFFPTISTTTHEKPGCKPSCIDNIITNDIESVITSGTIPNCITHHHQIFEIFESNVDKANSSQKYTQYYDYCDSNIEKLIEGLQSGIYKTPIDMF